ncbi:hypothetical protein [Flavobacterium sp. 102]|uniref:hypothetical protein n=1 Tax=Flavobacterium sp. 102 TaxID=2135623 RepID=UPI000EB46E07|nr:hypothetical protein [Flavobacterium sp. 102]RKS02895.1 hypothetical protein C8C84_2626 [Flavobacterium sp. 102]
MKKKLIFFLFLIIFVQCQKSEKVVSGDLYFKLVNPGSFYGFSESDVREIDFKMGQLHTKSELSKEEKKFLDLYDKLKRHNLLNSPCINLKNSSDSIITIYISEKENKRLLNFNLQELLAHKKKVKVQIKVNEIEENMFCSKEIISAKLVEGETYWKK